MKKAPRSCWERKKNWTKRNYSSSKESDWKRKPRSWKAPTRKKAPKKNWTFRRSWKACCSRFGTKN